MKTRAFFIAPICALLCTFGIVSTASAQDQYPSRAVRIVVAFPPGGSTDVVARLVAAKVSALWDNANIVIDNRPGASGTIGTGEVARAAPDGYTLTVGNSQTHGFNAALFPNLKYDLVKDVQPIASLASTKSVLVVRTESPIKDVPGFLAAARAGQLSFASVGNGATSHLIGEMLARKFNVKMTHVPYKGAAPAITDLLGGQVDYMAPTYGSISSFYKAGKVRFLAIDAPARDPRFPNVPTFAEAGLPSLGLDILVGIYGPAGMPRAVSQKWSDALAKVTATPEFATAVEQQGFDLDFKPLDQFEKFHRTEVPRLSAIIKETNVKLD